MQVVLPSVSCAAVPQGTALTVLVEMPSSAGVARPTVVPGFSGVPTAGAAPAIGTPEGGGGAAGSTVSAGCCASAGDDRTIRTAKTTHSDATTGTRR